jgi:hypothetical protein
VVSVVVPLILAVLPYARGCGFGSWFRLVYKEKPGTYIVTKRFTFCYQLHVAYSRYIILYM